ncbi:MAG: hypothetical protein ACK2U3_08075 [Anaerolineales bacterium]|jgi:hypothetical protein
MNGINWRVGKVAYNAGVEVRAYNRGDMNFKSGLDADKVMMSRWALPQCQQQIR